mmetsp:Transcript_93510/g.204776  ORF Transcript_93510/g.204776 Transcript_93510/m.204776 type:complete len:1463 (-) Transcript_93510:25-4413(-)
MMPMLHSTSALPLLMMMFAIVLLSLLATSDAGAPGIAWLMAEDGAVSCREACQACGGHCLEGELAWPGDFAWKCEPGLGQACTKLLTKESFPQYNLKEEPKCGWEKNPNAAKSCDESPMHTRRLEGQYQDRSSDARFCPCAVGQPASALEIPKSDGIQFECSFRVDDHLHTVYYNGTDRTSFVKWGMNWDSRRNISFSPWPGAYLVVYGEDINGDFYNSGGFWADCTTAPVKELSNRWEMFCDDKAIDNEHLQGDGWGWQKAAFHAKWSGMWKPGTLGAQGKRHCAFRTKPLGESYRCDVRVDDYVRKVHYNGMDITRIINGDLNRWDAVRRAYFPPIPGAYFVVYGEDVDGNFAKTGGFWADCDTAPSKFLETSWESYCSTKPLSEEYQQGKGTGWKKSTFHAGSHGMKEWAPGTLGEPGNGHCAFRMIPLAVPHLPEPETSTATSKPSTSAPPVDHSVVAHSTPEPTTVVVTTVPKTTPPPPTVPEGWKAIWDPNQEKYYFWHTSSKYVTWKLSEVEEKEREAEKKEEAEKKKEERTWDRPCKNEQACLEIIDDYLQHQPRQINGLLRTYGESLGGGDCGELCHLPSVCPTDPLIEGCRYDTYDNSMAALYFTKRGRHALAEEILKTFAELLYPKSLDGIPENVRYVGPSGKTLTLLAAAYSDTGKAKAGDYDGKGVYDGAVDVGNNAWAGLAFAHFAAETGSSCYADIARDILYALASRPVCNDGLKGYQGRLEPYPRNYRSTEHNVDVFALATVLGEHSLAERAKTFVEAMYSRNNAYDHSYSMGTGDSEEARCNTDQPFGPVPADCTYWTMLASVDPKQSHMSNALEFALRSPDDRDLTKAKDPNRALAQGMWTSDEDQIHWTGKKFYGTRFTTWGNGVQWEVTSAAAMALLHYSRHFGDLKRGSEKVDIHDHVKKIEDSLMLLLGMYKGVPGSILGGNRDAWIKWSMKQDKWRQDMKFPGGSDTGITWSYLRYTHVAATAWAGLFLLYKGPGDADMNEDVNPLRKPDKPMPASTKDCGCMGFPSGKPSPATTTAAPVTTRAATTQAPPTGGKHGGPPIPLEPLGGQDGDLPLFQRFVESHLSKPDLVPPAGPLSEVPTVLASVKVSSITDPSLGLSLDKETLTVLAISHPMATLDGWRLGDRIVSMEGTTLKDAKDLQSQVADWQKKKGASDAHAAANFQVVRMDICGYSCYDVIHGMKKACTSTWVDTCTENLPPRPFVARSILADVCPAECGTSEVNGAWTHQTNPGVEVVEISGFQIDWPSGRTTQLQKETDDGGVTRYSTMLYDKKYSGALLPGKDMLRWNDGDLWLRIAGQKAAEADVRSISAEAVTAEEMSNWINDHKTNLDGIYGDWLKFKNSQQRLQQKYASEGSQVGPIDDSERPLGLFSKAVFLPASYLVLLASVMLMLKVVYHHHHRRARRPSSLIALPSSELIPEVAQEGPEIDARMLLAVGAE